MPSGRRVYGSIFYGEKMSLDIYVRPDDQGTLEGLCGSFDHVSTNDYKFRGSDMLDNPSQGWNSNNFASSDFLNSWRLVSVSFNYIVELNSAVISVHKSIHKSF